MMVELIDLRSFSNLWYWIALAVVWSSASHWVMGIPYDLVLRARRQDPQGYIDLMDLVRINTNRIYKIVDMAGLWLLGFATFGLSSLAVLAFFFWVEFAQAIFMIAFPISFVALLTLRTAETIRRDHPEGEALFALLARHRFFVQLIGVVALFVTAMFGMYQNLSIGPFG